MLLFPCDDAPNRGTITEQRLRATGGGATSEVGAQGDRHQTSVLGRQRGAGAGLRRLRRLPGFFSFGEVRGRVLGMFACTTVDAKAPVVQRAS